MARPGKLSPDVQSKICEAIRAGHTYENAAALGGIHYDTFNNWRKRGQEERDRVDRNARATIKKDNQPYVEFYEAVKKAEADCADDMLITIKNAAIDGSWQAGAWLLERRYPATYARRTYSKIEGMDRLEQIAKDKGITVEAAIQALADALEGENDGTE